MKFPTNFLSQFYTFFETILLCCLDWLPVSVLQVLGLQKYTPMPAFDLYLRHGLLVAQAGLKVPM